MASLTEDTHIQLTKDNHFAINSEPIDIEPEQQYRINIKTTGLAGLPYCAYFAVIIFDQHNAEIARYVRWLNDFSGNPKNNVLIFTSGKSAKSVLFGYRVNVETPVKSDIELDLPDIYTIGLQQTVNMDDAYDDLNNYVIPPLPPLTQKEEDILERKMVWLFAPPRSGTTWLGTRLLAHRENLIWPEPWVGFHFASSMQQVGRMGSENPELQKMGQFKRLYDVMSNNGLYFFSPHHKNIWMPIVRKLIIARTYSHAQTFDKNVIIKEPNGSGAADIILECLPNSKMIFLVRDGRDVVDSRIDMHRPGSWSPLPQLKTPEARLRTIRTYSEMWNHLIQKVKDAYTKHDSELRIMVKYEDLRKNTLGELKKIYQFLRINASDEELEALIEQHDFKNIPASEKGPGKFHRAASTGGWENAFNQSEQQLMNSIMGPMLIQLGYKL